MTDGGNKQKRRERIVAVYGSAGTLPGTPDYDQAVTCGRYLAKAGYGVMTGGYGGTMGAVSRGAAEEGGHVIGVTVGLFRERGLVPNPFLHEEIHLPSLAERLNYLIAKPDAYVALKGGVGTLSEIALAWSLLQVREVPIRPMILVGAHWRPFLTTFKATSTIEERDLMFVKVIDTAEELVPALKAWWAQPPHIPSRIGDVEKTPPLGGSVDQP